MRYMLPGWVQTVLTPVFSLFILNPDQGCLTQLYCATSPEIEEKKYKGLYFVPYGKLDEPTEFVKNKEFGDKLIKFSEDLVKEKVGADAFHV
jgi:hypothetical protein